MSNFQDALRALHVGSVRDEALSDLVRIHQELREEFLKRHDDLNLGAAVDAVALAIEYLKPSSLQ